MNGASVGVVMGDAGPLLPLNECFGEYVEVGELVSLSGGHDPPRVGLG